MLDSTIPAVARAKHFAGRAAIIDSRGAHTYAELLDRSARVAAVLLRGRADLNEQRVAFLVSPGFAWVATFWGIWRAGGIAVPLPMGSPRPEMEYLIEDSKPETIIYDAQSAELLVPLAQQRGVIAMPVEDALAGGEATLPEVGTDRGAMILYTSGTTNRPKGVVTTHTNIAAQIATLVRAWEWTEDDRILLFLPLHHVHGIINVVSCALWSGAACEMLPRFDASTVMQRVASGELTLFMAVPTIYSKLIAAWESSSEDTKRAFSAGCRKFRVMVSGSAALPVATLERWREISGHTLLERYGMTEIGMALSNPLHGTRVPGAVGVPLPSVEARLVDEHGTGVAPGTPGEIEIRGPSVFREYLGKPEATQSSFRDGWFRTGDTAVIENGVFRILGRTNVDILKSGGHKISALEVEEVLRQHECIADCAVVGVPDPEWGERVAAAIVLREGKSLELDALRSWAKERIAGYKAPTQILTVAELPRNAMGKVTKPAVAKLFAQRKDELSQAS